MVLDEPKETDDVYTLNDFTFLIDKALHEKTGDVSVGYIVYPTGSGFKVASQNPVAGASACGTSCSC